MGLRLDIDPGDGSGSSTASTASTARLVIRHVYAHAGTYPVIGTVTDADTGESASVTRVVVVTPKRKRG